MAGKLAAATPDVTNPRGGAERGSRSTAMEYFARAGIAARGVVFLIVGVLALKLALGAGGKTTDQQGALKTIAQGSLGKVALAVVAIGLLGYALWRLIRAILGHGVNTGSDDAKDRIDSAVSAVAYGLLCVTAVQILLGSGGGGGGGQDKATAGVLGWPGGQLIVGAAGLIIIGVGIQQAVKGYKRKFMETSDTSGMDTRAEHGFELLGVAGHLARGVIFALIGGFVIKAAIEYDPDKAIGLDGALAAAAQAPFGKVFLGAVAIGLLCFGAFSVVDAKVREV